MTNINEISCRPRQILEATSRQYPGLWRLFDKVRSINGKNMKGWPENCFLPVGFVEAWHERDTGYSSNLQDRSEFRKEASLLCALAAWRVTQGIYRFDEDVYEAVRNTPVEGDLPSIVLSRLPEWCIYIETPNLTLLGEVIYGAWIYVDWLDWSEPLELRILVDSTTLMPIVLKLNQENIQEQMERIFEMNLDHGAVNAETASTLTKATVSCVNAILSLVLYLCSQAAEIGDGSRRPINPTPKRIKGGESRLFPPNKVTTWGVGVRMGAALRRATEYASSVECEANARNAPRGHIRRAHWHGFRSGPTKTADGNTVNTADRKFEVRWLPPLAINLGDLSDLPSTIRAVN